MAVPGDIVITEIMQNPDAVGDTLGEWFEIHNTTGADIDINGWVISDLGIDTHTINNGGPLIVPAGGYLVLGRVADTGTNGGVPVDYAYGADISLGNISDEIILKDNFGTEIDRVEYDDGATFPDPTGASMELNQGATDNNVGSNWSEAISLYGGGDFGTPGAANDALCFLAGTSIATPDGEAVVEKLAIGDEICTADGYTTHVRWIGHQTISRLRHGPNMQPVRIREGALGDGLPHSDLTVTADHGMVIDGLVINAAALVNGNTIDWVPMEELEDNFTVYHVETKNHDVILANGAPTETFVDYIGRQAFDNYGEYLELYGAERIIREMELPRISSARLVPEAIRVRLGLADDIGVQDYPLSA